jgi:peptidoglycan/xylan/chitin deacetylase (PgdA/CDA1 family)
MCVTVDDLPTASVLPQDAAAAEQLTRSLLDTFRRHGVPAIGFVNEGKLYVDGALQERRVALLQQWIDGGFELGNHTYSHMDLHRSSAQAFQADIDRGDAIASRLMTRARGKPRYFRHPFLHTGMQRATRESIEAFLKQNGYRVAPISIDNYDYVFAAAFDRAVAKGDVPAREKIAAEYVDYMESMIKYYEAQSVAIVGREIRQTLLIHANALNASAFDALARRIAARGYRFVSLDRALGDPAYGQPDEYYGPAGITWLHRWAMTQKKPSSIFGTEPAVPDWIQQASALPR